MSAKNRQNIKLTYFDLNARAALPRLVLAVANVKYEDERIRLFVDGKMHMADWNALKPKTPLGSLPILTVGDVVLCESFQITRYLGEEFQLSGENALARAKVNIVGNLMYETFDAFLAEVNSIMVKPENKSEAFKTYMEKKGIPGLEKIEKAIKLYGQNGFAASNRMTWADLGIFLLAKMISDIDPNVIKNYPEVAKVHATTGSNHLVADHIKNRPPRPH